MHCQLLILYKCYEMIIDYLFVFKCLNYSEDNSKEMLSDAS